MEYCGGGDLSRVIKNLQAKNQYAEEDFVWSIFAQLITALYRCHYGVDPPEVGKNVLRQEIDGKQPSLRPKNQFMILHRDLKPENVFLGADNTVKLGDFGLSKLMQSHDFASTYVGTPFYMSPEICAAEKYTLHSDIWSLGCIMYELCARHPPFNAKTHFHLVQKIKEGRVDPLPSIYSQELQCAIKSCLKTNPLMRPDTASLMQLPVVRLMRKEREVVEIGKTLKTKEEEALIKAAELQAKLASHDIEKHKMRLEIESTVRREWEVKARLEIDRQIQLETERLCKKFDVEVKARVDAEVQKITSSIKATEEVRSLSPAGFPMSSISIHDDSDFPSSTDMSSLSLESPESQKANKMPPKKTTRTPFARARTQYDSPMDVHMAEPSPMSIASLALSPRRNAATARTGAVPPNNSNIFAKGAQQKSRWQANTLLTSLSDDGEDDFEDEIDNLPDLPSPTRPPRGAVPDPFKMPSHPARPGLLRQKTAPMQPMQQQTHQHKPTLFPTKTTAVTADETSSTNSLLSQKRQQQAYCGPKPISPNRTLAANRPLNTSGDRLSPVHYAPASLSSKLQSKTTKVNPGGDGMLKAAILRNMPNGPENNAALGGGRTLVELAQARAGGYAGGAPGMQPTAGGDENYPPMGFGGNWENAKAVAKQKALTEAVRWDPEIHEMPSPFLRRGKNMR